MFTKRLGAAATLVVLFCSVAQASAPTTPARPAPVAREMHPEINHAIDALDKARWHLQHAAHDFGGHRVEAIGAIDAALNQLHMALRYDH